MRSLAGPPYAVLLAVLLAAVVISALLLPLLRDAGPLAAGALLFAVFGAAAAVGYLPFRKLARRFDVIAGCARSMAAGDLAARAPVEEHDELGHLARALNGLATRYEAKLAELHTERDAGDAILAHVPLGLALLGPNLAIRHANARFWEMMGLPRPEGTVRISAARQPALEQMALESIRGRRSLVRDVTFYSGERREYEVQVTPVGPDGSSAEALLLSVEDLGPEKTMAALRREFVANASHELKTPLTSIRGYAETLLAGGLEDEANRTRFVETIHAQASRLEALVEDLLELADLERPDAPLDLKDWDMGEMARDMGETFEDVASRRGLRLAVDARPGIHARADRKRLELALRNLLDNAVKYTDQGSVTLRVEDAGPAVRVEVADTGRGVAAEHLPRLFERFYRVDRGRSRAMGGTGLGLSIVKHVVQLHGGRVGVTSRPGEGSVFWLEIPAAGPAAP